MEIKTWFDRATCTLTYCVYDAKTRDAIVIDAVWDFDQPSGELKKTSVEVIAEFIKSNRLNLHYILETHPHADHITGAQPLKKLFPSAKIGIGSGVTKVQQTFKAIYNFGEEFKTDGSQFDCLFADGSLISAGSIHFRTIFTPGHTPSCASFLIEDAVFVGDVLFMPDYGTGRCDFPEGSAADLYESIKKLYKLPESVRVFTGHDYMPGGRPVAWESTIAEQKNSNIHLRSETTKQEFVERRSSRDRTLSAPKLLWPSIQVNVAAGQLPNAEKNGKRYLKLPITSLQY